MASDTNSSSQAAFHLTNGANAELNLAGTNTLKSAGFFAGLEVHFASTLSITAADAGAGLDASSVEGPGIGGTAGGDDNNSISIHGGIITATGGMSGPGIGGMGGGGNSISIHGGTVTANGSMMSAGIGGMGGDDNSISIHGGTVTANSGVMIGSGIGDMIGNGNSISIYGGTVTASGGMMGGSGIGGMGGNSISIQGGTVTANSSMTDVGIGGTGGSISITGGVVTATSGGTFGIGNSTDSTVISGGTVTATGVSFDIGGDVQITGGSIYPLNGAARVNSPTSDGSTPVYLNTLTVGNPAVADGTAVTDITVPGLSGSYGSKDINTMNGGKIYLWLPENSSANASVRVVAENYYYKSTFPRPIGEVTETLLRGNRVPGGELAAGITPQSAAFDHQTRGALPVQLTMGSHSFENILMGNRLLLGGLHYTVKGNTYTFKESFLDSLAAGSYDITFGMTGGNDPVLKLTVTGVHNCPGVKYSDVDTTEWYHAALDYVTRNDLMRGVSPTLFRPHTTLTRGMLATVLYRAEGEPAVGAAAGFEDVSKSAWYHDPVLWARENGIVTGYSETRFGPEDPLTREQMAAMLDRYCNYKGMELPLVNSDASFTDIDSVSGWAKESVEAMYRAGLVNGKGGGVFDPKAQTTRIQTAQVITNLMEQTGR